MIIFQEKIFDGTRSTITVQFSAHFAFPIGGLVCDYEGSSSYIHIEFPNLTKKITENIINFLLVSLFAIWTDIAFPCLLKDTQI